MHLVTDSTGLKVFGEGEWRKLHLPVDEATNMIMAHKLTTGQRA